MLPVFSGHNSSLFLFVHGHQLNCRNETEDAILWCLVTKTSLGQRVLILVESQGMGICLYVQNIPSGGIQDGK